MRKWANVKAAEWPGSKTRHGMPWARGGMRARWGTSMASSFKDFLWEPTASHWIWWKRSTRDTRWAAHHWTGWWWTHPFPPLSSLCYWLDAYLLQCKELGRDSFICMLGAKQDGVRLGSVLFLRMYCKMLWKMLMWHTINLVVSHILERILFLFLFAHMGVSRQPSIKNS